MKKNLTIGFGFLALGVSITVFAYHWLPTAAEIQIGTHQRDAETLRLSVERTETLWAIEEESFCFKTDLMRAERMEITFEQNERYKEIYCEMYHGKYELLKIPTEKNSKGEKHPDQFIGNGANQKERVRSYVERNCIESIAEVFEETYSYAENSGINPAIPFAIISADSSCGKHLATPNNPGNVNNNDRGNRTGFFSMKDGINAVTDTLNNRYIEGIEKLGHLSQGGRMEIGSKFSCETAPLPFKCYASSTENWNNNAKRALKAMGYPDVDGNFLIRK